MNNKIVFLTAALLAASATSAMAAKSVQGNVKLGVLPVAISAGIASGSETQSFDLNLDAAADTQSGNIRLVMWQVPEPLTQTVTLGNPYSSSNVFELITAGKDVAKGSITVNYTVTIGGKQFTDKEVLPVDIANNVFGNIDTVLPPQNGIVCEFIANNGSGQPAKAKIQIECTN